MLPPLLVQVILCPHLCCLSIAKSSSSSVSDASPLAAMGTNKRSPLSSVTRQVQCCPSVSPSDIMSSFMLSTHRSLGLPLFPLPSNLECSVLSGILSDGILSTYPNHRSNGRA